MAGSILDALNARLPEIRARRAKRYPFPGWPEEDLTIKLQPVDTAVSEDIVRRINDGPRRDKTVAIQAAIVAAGTVTVRFQGQDYTLKDFADAAGMTDADAGDVIRHLATADGDVKTLADAVMALGGYTAVIKELEGE